MKLIILAGVASVLLAGCASAPADSASNNNENMVAAFDSDAYTPTGSNIRRKKRDNDTRAESMSGDDAMRQLQSVPIGPAPSSR
jgi:PBP1b-binding outer membrane lipoprotein LpoB